MILCTLLHELLLTNPNIVFQQNPKVLESAAGSIFVLDQIYIHGLCIWFSLLLNLSSDYEMQADYFQQYKPNLINYQVY